MTTNDIAFGGRVLARLAIPDARPDAVNHAGIPDYGAVAVTPDWHERAACRSADPELFFPDLKRRKEAAEKTAEAKAICARCTVTVQCLTWALDTHQRFGVWGAHDEQERAEITNAHAKPREREQALRRAARLTDQAAAAIETESSMSPKPTAVTQASPTPPATVTLAEAPPAAQPQSTIGPPPVPVHVKLPSYRRSPTSPDTRRPLSERESEVLHLMAFGLTNEQIGSRLGVTAATVKKHKGRIVKALGANGDATHCVARGFARGELKPHPHEECAALEAKHVETLVMLALGLSNPQMARKLGKSVDAVKSRVRILLRALDVENRMAAVGCAFRWGLLEAVPDPDEAC